ncbi:MAG: PKD domain-containing protein [Actinomycetota bacterium]|nr:PKD domain-containing protein [Actinomycetota bacterium]
MEELLKDRYSLREELEQGLCVSTFAAWDRVLEVELEVDVLQVERCPFPAGVKRLREVLDTAGEVTGSHAASLFEWLEEDGKIYLIRERIKGTPLSELVSEMRELPLQQVVEVVKACAETLAQAYGKGLFYLGLNPGQVVVGERGGIKINRVGYGWLLEDMEPLTAARVSTYRAPETDGGREGSRTSDVYALAVMIREMLPVGEGSERLLSLLQKANDALPNRRPSSPRLLLEELEGGVAAGGVEESVLRTEGTEEAEGKRAGGLSFLKDGPRPSPSISLDKRRGRRPWKSLMLILLGGITLWLGFAAVSGAIGGSGEGEPSAELTAGEVGLTLPDLRGLEASEAEKMLWDMGLEATSREAPSRLWSAGRVAAQEPEKGSVLERGEVVLLVISSGSGDELPGDGEKDVGDDPVPAGEGEEGGEAGETGGSGESELSPSADSMGHEQSVPPADPFPDPLPPRAVPVLSARSGPAPFYVAMDGSGSYDPDGDIDRYVWDCGDGTVLEGASVQHVYDPPVIPMSYMVVLRVFDRDGLNHSSSLVVEVF